MAKRKNPHAVALGRKGGLIGGSKAGKARMGALTPEQRRELAQKAALARWGKQSKSAVETHLSEENNESADESNT